MFFTIIIATCDRPDRLKKSLDAIRIAIQASNESHRVIVIDNGVKGQTQKMVAQFASQIPFEVKYFKSEPRNKAKALNLGIGEVRSGWLAFTDDDVLPDSKWLVNAAHYASGSEVNIFGGRVISEEPNDTFPSWIKSGKSGCIPMGPAIVRYAPMPDSGLLDSKMQMPLGANVFIKKSIFDQYGKYDEELWKKCGKAALGSEDAEFAIRVRSKGENIGYSKDALVVHALDISRASLRHHLRWSFRMGFREPILFPEAVSQTSVFYLAWAGMKSLFKAVGFFLKGDCPASVCELMRIAQICGQVSGKRICNNI